MKNMVVHCTAAALLGAIILRQIATATDGGNTDAECGGGQCKKYCQNKNDCLLNVITVWANNGQIDWQRVLEANPNLWQKTQKVLGDAKATENSTFQDPSFEENFRAMKAIGMAHRGAYHYFRGEPGSASAKAQFQNFINTSIRAGFDAKKDFAAINNEGSNKDNFTEKLFQFVTLLKREVTNNIFIHTSADFWSALVNTKHDDFFAQFPLSVIDYDSEQRPTLPRPWTVWQRWLHTMDVPVNGISGPVWLSRVNCNVTLMPDIF